MTCQMCIGKSWSKIEIVLRSRMFADMMQAHLVHCMYAPEGVVILDFNAEIDIRRSSWWRSSVKSEASGCKMMPMTPVSLVRACLMSTLLLQCLLILMLFVWARLMPTFYLRHLLIFSMPVMHWADVNFLCSMPSESYGLEPWLISTFFAPVSAFDVWCQFLSFWCLHSVRTLGRCAHASLSVSLHPFPLPLSLSLSLCFFCFPSSFPSSPSGSLSLSLYVCLSVCRSVCLCVRLSVFLSVCLPPCACSFRPLCVCLSVPDCEREREREREREGGQAFKPGSPGYGHSPCDVHVIVMMIGRAWAHRTPKWRMQCCWVWSRQANQFRISRLWSGFWARDAQKLG